MKAIIYKPTKTATQSGLAKNKFWLLEYPEQTATNIEPIMGWVTGNDTKQQLSLKFSNLETAENYAKKNKIPYEVRKSELKKILRKSYTENFK